MLITRDPDWTDADWPGPRCLVLPPEAPDARPPGSDWRRFTLVDGPGGALSVIRDVAARLARFRQLAPTPLLHAPERIAEPELAALRDRAGAEPFAADLALTPGGRAGRFLLGAEIVANPLFVAFFANLRRPESLDPEAVFDQLRFHLVPQEDAADEEARP